MSSPRVLLLHALRSLTPTRSQTYGMLIYKQLGPAAEQEFAKVRL